MFYSNFPVIEPNFIQSFINQINKYNEKSQLNFILKNFQSSKRNSKYFDRFVIEIIHNSNKFEIQVIFDLNNLNSSPDLILPPSFEFKIHYPNIQSFQRWNSKDPTSLRKLIEEVYFTIFKQSKKNFPNWILENKKIKFEIEMFQQNPNIKINFDEETKFVIFSIPIQNQHFPNVSLIFQFYYPFKNSPKISSSKNGSVLNHTPFPLIPWTNDSCIVTYIASIRKLIEMNILNIKELKTKREKMIESLIEIFGTPLEYDSESFFSISFLISTKNFPFIIFFQFPDNFPNEKIDIRIQSVCFYRGKLRRRKITNYPYSPSDEPIIKTLKIQKYITERIDNFQDICLNDHFR
ncbi:brisc and brca1-a complex member 2 [Anaeramoeba ignava]|uniref:BRISC and BRCA1-A complex member 2 n=1 Tax=Anaeramoeba ignava TaxID=1746090 RepID=A0A9Q0LET9_ANAIG|nr:brisc and brca1-a complex member 2 [Anaeramoeba ignava]